MKPQLPVAAHVDVVNRRSDAALYVSLAVGALTHNHRRVKISPSYIFPFFMLWVSLVPGLVAQDNYRGTTVAWMRTPTQIAVAADSIGVAIDDPFKTKPQCKILKMEEGRFYVGIAGISPSDYIERAVEDYRKTKTLRNAVSEFSADIIRPLKENLRTVRRNPKVDWESDYERKTAVSFVFFGFEGGIPVAYQREFVAFTDNQGSIQIKKPEETDCHGNICSDGIGGGVIGGWKAAKAKTPTFSIKDNPATIVENIVQAEIDFYKGRKIKKVGPPISVLQIDAAFRLDIGEARWIKRGVCPELK